MHVSQSFKFLVRTFLVKVRHASVHLKYVQLEPGLVGEGQSNNARTDLILTLSRFKLAKNNELWLHDFYAKTNYNYLQQIKKNT